VRNMKAADTMGSCNFAAAQAAREGVAIIERLDHAEACTLKIWRRRLIVHMGSKRRERTIFCGSIVVFVGSGLLERAGGVADDPAMRRNYW